LIPEGGKKYDKTCQKVSYRGASLAISRALVVRQSSIDECCGILFPETIFKCVFQEQESCGGKVSGYADG
jgi:hypothetical protein